jgi:hypothetical protein
MDILWFITDPAKKGSSSVRKLSRRSTKPIEGVEKAHERGHKEKQ